MEYQLILLGVLIVALLYSFYVGSRQSTSPVTDLLGSKSLDVRFNTYDYSLLKKLREKQEPFRIVQHMMPVSVDTGYDVVGYNY